MGPDLAHPLLRAAPSRAASTPAAAPNEAGPLGHTATGPDTCLQTNSQGYDLKWDVSGHKHGLWPRPSIGFLHS